MVQVLYLRRIVGIGLWRVGCSGLGQQVPPGHAAEVTKTRVRAAVLEIGMAISEKMNLRNVLSGERGKSPG